jgi:RING-H2 zinc finger protein RHA1
MVPLVSFCVAVPRPLFLLVKFLSQIRVEILFVVSYVSSCLLPGWTGNRTHRPHGLVQQPLPPPSTIKEQLPAMEFMSISHKFKDRKKCQSEDKHICIVCLENLEPTSQIRVLGNCDHTFHQACIDQWIDAGQVICPLCRAQLLPTKDKGIRMLLRIFSLHSD